MADASLRTRLIDALEQSCAEHGIDIVDVEINAASKVPAVVVRIDHADESLPTISLDEIAAQSAWIGECIDVVDPFPSSYTLEVSSPGMERPLRKAHDFERFAGSTVTLQTNATEGRRKFTGTLEGIDGETVALSCDDGSFTFDLSDIKRCTIKPVYDFSGTSEKRG